MPRAASRSYAAISCLLALLTLGCSARQIETKEELATAERSAERAKNAFLETDPGMETFFEDAYGYVIFPSVGKGAAGIGGAHGQGLVFEQGEVIGTSALSQATIGFQLGGQEYQEVIFFRTEDALDDFTAGNFEFSAQASAVAATAGASATADYDKGVAVFTATKAGLMYEASIGGQKFSYRPLDDVN